MQAFYGIRSARLLHEQLHYNLLYRCFVGLSPDDPTWHPTTFTKNREQLQGRLKVISSRARCHASQCEHSPDVVAQFLLARVN